MGHITKQERLGLEELFASIEEYRYTPHYRRTLVMFTRLARHYPAAILKLLKTLRR